MTKINKLVLHGFKSFAKHTELLFGNGFNVVLGPNGSGKSNILDALCFVLGKASSKSLRAEKSSNLIYNGGKSKKPSSHAEVSIYFDNSKRVFPSKDDTVKITRVVKPNGSSAYKINDELRTRQQIVDLLAYARINPDGYNIILQGDIIQFVEMSSIEKRMLVDEISGISVYEEKKNKALNELEKVATKLNEADIILKERKAYLKELKHDRDQALKFKELDDQIKSNKASYLKININRKLGQKEELDSRISRRGDELRSLQEKADASKKSIAGKKEVIDTIAMEIEEKGEKEQLALQKEIEQLRVDIASNRTRISSHENEINRILQRKEQLQRNLAELNEKMESSNAQKQGLEKEKSAKLAELAALDRKVSDFKRKNKIDIDLENTEKDIESIDKDAESRQLEIQKLREEQQGLLREKDRLDFQIQVMDERIRKVHEVEKEHQKDLDALKRKREDFKKTEGQLENALARTAALAAEIAGIEKRLLDSREMLSKLKIRNASVKEHISLNMAVKKILESKSRFRNVYGTVAELANVPEKFSSAVEVAVGPRANSLVVDTDKTAVDCINFLKKNQLGRATFLPLNRIKPSPKDSRVEALAKYKGVHGIATALISYDRKFENVFSYLLGNTLIVDDIELCRKIGIGSARMVTLDGDLSELSGVMHGGFRQKKGIFKEKDLDKEIEDIDTEVSRLQKSLGSLEEERLDSEKNSYILKDKKSVLQGEIIRIEKSLHIEDSDLDATKNFKEELITKRSGAASRFDEVGRKISEANKALIAVKERKQQLRNKLSELRSPVLVAELNAFEQKRAELKDAIAGIDAEVKGIDTQLADIFGRDRENIVKILKDIEDEQKLFSREISELKEKISGQEKALKAKEVVQQRFYANFRELFNNRNRLNDEINKIERQIEELQAKAREIERIMNSLSLDNAKVKAELSALEAEFAQYEGVPLHMKKPVEELKREIAEFERLRQSIGSVNMRALEIYETVEKEYASLIEKQSKLVSEKEDIERLMKEIDSKKKELFVKTYDILNQNFQKTFSLLSHKGHAFLELENAENPFEAGLMIKVKISSNKFMDIRSLSGGEKSLTALAFIFAVQEFEPASFYVLDEVDAALDKHNSEKFARLIKQYSGKAQYVIISHNDSVISEGDSLYGVSMDEHGISKVVSLKV